MLDMMGHVSPAMLRRYSHIRAEARREAIAAPENRVSFGVPDFPQSRRKRRKDESHKRLNFIGLGR